MYDTWITPSERNAPELPIGWYSSIDKPIEFPWLTLAEYKERWLLQKGCGNLKNNKRYISTERILFLSYSI